MGSILTCLRGIQLSLEKDNPLDGETMGDTDPILIRAAPPRSRCTRNRAKSCEVIFPECGKGQNPSYRVSRFLSGLGRESFAIPLMGAALAANPYLKSARA
jgi:hypothetical protein